MLKWLPLLWSNLWRRKTRSALTMLSVFATFILVGSLGSFRNAVATYGDDYANSVVVQSRNVRLPYSHVTRLLSMPGITAACGVLMSPVQLPSGKRAPIQAVNDRALFEVFPDITVSPEGAATWGRDRTAVLISADVAKDNGWRVGDRVMLPGHPRGPAYQRPDGRNALEIVVAGIFSARNTVAAHGIFAHYEYVRDLIGARRAGMEYIAVRLAAGQDVDIQRARIDAEFENSPAPVKTYSSRALLRAYYGAYREFALLALVVLTISSLTLLLIAGTVLAQAQRERARECAVLEAIGWSKARVAAFLALESAALLLPAAASGLVVAGVLAQKIHAGISLASQGWLPARVIVGSLLLAALFAIAVAVIPVVRSFTAPIAPGLARE
jgi:putative ABC transport system permease protein